MAVHIVRPDDSVHSINRQAALVGFTMRGEDVRLFDGHEIESIAIADGDIVFGGVRTVRRAFDRLGWTVPAIQSVPEGLGDFAGRRTWQATMGEARRRVENGRAVFVKPLASDLKRFTGQPLRKFSDLVSTAHVPDETEVECAEITRFVSEFRTFVLHGRVIGLRHYGGDPLRLPDVNVIQAMVSRYRQGPAGYALDVGVVEDGRTLLVEINDSYATGAYGLAPALYASFIEARWEQLRQQQNTTAGS